MDLVCKEDFQTAEDAAKKIIKKDPDNPAGYFFVAVAIDAWMEYYFDKTKENEFYKYCDLAIEKSEKILAVKPDDEWAVFFMGGADGYKGTYEGRYERWITAYRYGWRGVSTLQKLDKMECDIFDIYFGIGSYEYWRSAMINTLWFMPKVNDRRAEGIKKLYISAEKGMLTKSASYCALVDILLNENQVEDALKISEKMVRLYPASTMFLWGKARALYGVGRFKESRQILLSMLVKYESDKGRHYYYPLLCHYWLVRIAAAEKKYAEVIKEADLVKKYKLDDEIKKLLGKYIDEVSDLKKIAQDEIKQK